MVERLLLDRIDAKTGSPPVAGQQHALIVSLSNETKAALIRTQFAFARAEIALDAAVGKPVPPLSAHDAGLNQLTGKSWHPSFARIWLGPAQRNQKAGGTGNRTLRSQRFNLVLNLGIFV